MSIRLRLTLLFGIATLVLLAGGGTLFVTQLRRGLDQSLTQTLATRADNLKNELTALGPNPGLDRRILRVSASGTFVQLLTGTGRFITGSRALGARPLLSSGETKRATQRTVVLNRTVELPALEEPRSEAMRLITRRLRPGNDVLVVGVSREVVDEAVKRARDQMLLLGAAVLFLAGPGAWLLTGAALRPVERMRREVRDLEASNAGVGLRVPKTRDEIARLAETFNVVLARMHAAVTREQALVADAGHELRTPLTVLKGELELAQRPGRSREALAHTVAVAAEETERLVRLTEDLLFLSRAEAEDSRAVPSEPFDVVAVVSRALEALQPAAAGRCVRLDLVAPAPLEALGNAEWIRRAVDNLLANALRYSPPGSVITAGVGRTGDRVRLTVVDEGPGFPPEFLPFAFDRFRRADDSRVRTGAGPHGDGGSGLGLAIVRSILTRHGGTAVARNRPGGGAEVVLEWPLG